jgi:hypothetical protein
MGSSMIDWTLFDTDPGDDPGAGSAGAGDASGSAGGATAGPSRFDQLMNINRGSGSSGGSGGTPTLAVAQPKASGGTPTLAVAQPKAPKLGALPTATLPTLVLPDVPTLPAYTAPTYTAPTYTAPQRDDKRQRFLTDKAGRASSARLSQALQQALVQGQAVENPVARGEYVRRAMEGYGSGLGDVLASANAAGQNQYNVEYAGTVDEAKTQYSANVDQAKANYQAAVDQAQKNWATATEQQRMQYQAAVDQARAAWDTATQQAQLDNAGQVQQILANFNLETQTYLQNLGDYLSQPLGQRSGGNVVPASGKAGTGLMFRGQPWRS